MTSRFILGSAVLSALAVAPASAQVTIVLPDSTLTTTMTASVTEQARVTVPSAVSFTVGDITAATTATDAAVTIDQIVLASATKQVRISMQAGAASFTPPTGGAPTWDADDVSWNAAAWTQATGSAGTLSAASFTTVATCTAGVSSCSTTGLQFTLAPNGTITTSGDHTLTVTWRIESIGS